MTDDIESPPPIRETFDRIATDFDRTRDRPWPPVERFVAGAAGGEVGLDLGCGNARHTELLSGKVARPIGLDISPNVLATARDRSIDRGFPLLPILGDARSLPIANRCVSVGLYIAALHHLRTARERRRSLTEFERVLTPNGVGLISVWSTTHDRFDRSESFETTIGWTLPDGETVPRYYHIFSPADFEALLDESPLVVLDTFEADGNCYGVVGSRNGEQKHP